MMKNEDIATNNVSSGNVSTFDPLLGQKKKKKTSELVKRWMNNANNS